jgi:alpha-L-rhamnosidase
MKQFFIHKTLIVSMLLLSAMTFIFANQVNNNATVTATTLRVEYVINPMGIDIVSPRFSWALESDARMVTQTSYRILVATSKADLIIGNPNLIWDSGKVESDNTFGVKYEGKTLEPTTRYYWTVISETAINGIPNGAAKVDTSNLGNEGAFWETGFFDTTMTAWSGAQWISSSSVFETSNEPLFRKAFETQNAEIAKARLYATARGYYEFSINGEKVGDQFLSPGWSDYFYTIMYETFDVTDMLKNNASNVIGAMTAWGWWSGNHQMMSLNRANRNLYGDTQSVLGKLVITYKDGTQQIIVTDNSWLYNFGPIIYADNYRGEGFDARIAAQRKDWNTADYPSSKLADWQPARIVPFEPTGKGMTFAPLTDSTRFEQNPILIGQVEPPIREVSRFSLNNPDPKKRIIEVTPKTDPDRRTWNLGQNISGFLTIKVRGNAGDTITIRHSEMLNTTSAYRDSRLSPEQIGGGDGPPGTIFRRALRDRFVSGEKVAVNTYILSGDPDGEEWTPRFTFHGFQYFEILGNNVDITPENNDRFKILDIQAIAISSDNEMTSAFESSHHGLNQLYSNTLWSILGNHVGVPTDCPNRDERLGYTGDLQIIAQSATYIQNTVQFYNRWLRDLRDYQSTQIDERHGVVPMLIPNNPRQANFSTQWANGWGDAATIVPWQMFQMFGDKQVIYDSYESMKAWCDFLRRGTVDNIRDVSATTDTRQWDLGDWVSLETNSAETRKLTNSLLTAHSHNLFASMASAVGKYDTAEEYETYARQMTDAILATFRQPDGRLMVGDIENQTPYAMILYFNLDSENNAKYAERLAQLIQANGGKMASGFIGVAYLIPVLAQNGQLETAFILLEQEAFPSWLYSVNQGATTIWERWNSYVEGEGFHPDGMNSFNHFVFGSVTQWLMSGLLGIDRDESCVENAGFRRFILNPQYGGTITYTKGHYDSVSGRIESDWRWHEDGRFEYNFTIPANTVATVFIPSADISSSIREGGKELLMNDGGETGVQGIRFLRYDAVSQRAVFEIQSGVYKFVSIATP